MSSLDKVRITGAERIVVDVPFTPRCRRWNAREVWQWQISEVIRLTTDAGVSGYGETILHYTWGRVPDEAIERAVGARPGELLGDDTLGAGLQMALYDVVGKLLEVPVYRLFNLPKARDWCPISWWNIDMPPEAFAAEAREALEHGYTSYKIKARPWWDVYEQTKAIANVTPPNFRLDLDWNNMLLNAGNAAPVLTALDREPRVAIYESPIMQRDVEGQRLLRQKTTRPIALHFGDPPFPTAVREMVCDGFVVSGGVSRVLRQGALAEAFEKPFWLQLVGTGLTTAMSAHLGCVLPFAQWPAVNCLNNYSDDLLAQPLTIQGGAVRVPEAPGLGVEVDEGAIERYRMNPPHEHPKPRLLLTVRWEGGRTVHFSSLRQCWNDCWAGNHPVQEPGVKMEVRSDDGSPEWAELYRRTEAAPVWGEG
ncbi:MAG: mandelate racemase/muconate lactonizing enzyme family protein [Armatimonadetes bacterium]|nr:mandelate racemase/muconate lactonizing enzyme family protein [Armatimonadota bacterium]MDE2206221.1 mandelate racemase/muconate lactonizing enzyme family protein [Armatimonadota bacterium]